MDPVNLAAIEADANRVLDSLRDVTYTWYMLVNCPDCKETYCTLLEEEGVPRIWIDDQAKLTHHETYTGHGWTRTVSREYFEVPRIQYRKLSQPITRSGRNASLAWHELPNEDKELFEKLARYG